MLVEISIKFRFSGNSLSSVMVGSNDISPVTGLTPAICQRNLHDVPDLKVDALRVLDSQTFNSS